MTTNRTHRDHARTGRRVAAAAAALTFGLLGVTACGSKGSPSGSGSGVGDTGGSAGVSGSAGVGK